MELLTDLGFIKLKRKNVKDDIEKGNRTEVFSGKSNRSTENIVTKGDELSVELIRKLIEIKDSDVFKVDLVLKPHQEEAIEFITDRFNKGETDVLLNHKARSGKSFISYHFLINNSYGIKNTLLLTQYPILNEQWSRELKNIKGHDINIINCSNLQDRHDIIELKDGSNLVMISLQDAKGNDKELDGVKELDDAEIAEFLNKQKFDVIKNIDWDLIIFDEVHKGKETQKTDVLLSNLKYKKLIGLSATPTKNLLRGTFKQENTHVYDLVKEREYRIRYGRAIYDVPDIRFNLMYMDDIKDELKYFEENEYFNFKKFFKVVDGKLWYYDDIKLYFKWIFGIGGRFRDNSLDNIIGRADIENILIFVETNECQSLIVDCLNDIGGRFNNYNIHYTNSSINSSNKLLRMIDDIDNTPGKSIVFANRQLTTGITLRKCDIVMFMNDWHGMDEYIQASYRCQSPSTTKIKRFTNVFDFNPSRSFEILYEYIRTSSIDKSYDFDDSTREFLKCANVQMYENGHFEIIDVDSFRNNIIKNFDFSDKRIFKKISNKIDFSRIPTDIKDSISALGHFTQGKMKSERMKLNDESVDSGNTHKQDDKEDIERTKNIEQLENNLMDNVDYYISKTPLMSFFSWCGYNSVDSVLEYLDNNSVQRNLYIESLLISTNLDNDTIFIRLKNLYNSLNIKNMLDDSILFFNKKYEDILMTYLENNDIIMFIENVLKLIESYIGISESEKKQLGEVFTPFELIDEMLDTLPKEVWSDSTLKWLDPSDGIGNFPIRIVGRLLEGLKDFEPDYDKRYKHIMENMIYVCDINPKNMFIFNNLFDPNNNLKLNTYTGSFLGDGFDNWMKITGVDKFDVVVGNPPYQEKVGRRKSEPIWDKFVSKSFTILSENGYLNMVHPSSWRSPKGRFRHIYDLFIDKNLIYLSMNDFKSGQNIFGVGTNFDFYCIKNTINKNNKTKIKTIDNDTVEINLSNYSFIPNGKFDIFQKLIANPNETTVDVLYSRSSYGTDKINMSREQSEEFKYPCIYTITTKGGINLFYSNTNQNGHYDIPKIIWSNGLGTYPIIDNDGIYGITQFSYAIIDEKQNFKNIKNVLMSDEFIKLMDYVKFTNNKYDYKVIQTLKKDFWKDDYFTNQ